jgi:glycosyltransferase involved in cell wall biosynthesis
VSEAQRVSIVARASGADLSWLEALAASAGPNVEVIAVVVPESGPAEPHAHPGVAATLVLRVPVDPAGSTAADVDALASAIALAQGAWLLLLERGDRLATGALDRLLAQAHADALAVLAGVAAAEGALGALVADPRALAGSLVRTALVARVAGPDPAAGRAWELDLWLRLLPSLAGSPVVDATLAERAPLAAEASRERAVVLARAFAETPATAWPLAPARVPSSTEKSTAGTSEPDEASACRELARLAASTGSPELRGVAAMLWLRGGATRAEAAPPALVAALPGLSHGVVPAFPSSAARRDADAPDALRVVLEVRSLDRGGLESVVVDLALGLGREGIVPSVVCTERGGTEVERLRSAGVEVLILGAADRAAELAAWLDARDVDLLNPHYSDLGTPLAAARGIPVVVTLHNEYAWVPNRQGDPFRALHPLVDAYVAVSASAAEFCAARFGLAPERVRVIRNALSGAGSRRSSLDRLAARAELDIPADAELLLQVGRVDAIKAPLALVDAVAVLADDRPQLCAWIVGPLADRDYAARLRARIDELGLPDRIFVAGRRGDVPRLLAAADVFVLPSLIEGLSLAVVEALAAGVPAVLSRTGDAGFLLGEGGEATAGSAGVLPGALVARPAIDPVRITPETFHDLAWRCDPARGALLAAAIAEVLGDLPARREAARRRAVELAPLLAGDRMLRDYATLFRSVVQERAARGLEFLDRSIALARSRHELAQSGTAALRVAVHDLLAAEAAFLRERSRADANAAALAGLSGVVERASSALAPAGDKLERAIEKLGLGTRLRAAFRAATGRSEGERR